MATTKALLIPFENDKPVQVLDLESGFEHMYPLIAPDSRMIEVLRTEQFELFLDEEGGPLMRSDAGERINARAMQLYAFAHNITDPSAFAYPFCGDFIAMGLIDAEGERNADVPEWVTEFPFSWSVTVVDL